MKPMFTRNKSFSVLYGVQRSFLTIFYLISAISVFWLIFYLMSDVFQTAGSFLIPVSLAYLVLVVLGYSIIQVISYIPANLAGAFDPLKNGIADGSIASTTELAGKLADFFLGFFNFAFFDVHYAIVKLADLEPQTAVGNHGLKLNPDELATFADSLDQTALYGRFPSGSFRLYLYVTPLIFGEQRLGYFAVATRQKLWGMFVQLLNEFENDYIDDQVVHMMARDAGALA